MNAHERPEKGSKNMHGDSSDSVEVGATGMAQFESLLTKLGFKINHKKKLDPAQVIEFTGTIIDVKHGVVAITTKKCTKARLLIHDILAMATALNGYVTTSALDKLTGFLASLMLPLVGAAAHLRGAWNLLATARFQQAGYLYTYSHVYLPAACKDGLLWAPW